MADLDELRHAFENATEFNTSPLYRALSKMVAASTSLLHMASRTGPGQYPTYLFFGSIHHILLGGADHELAAFYPSIVGDRARPADDAGPALVSFCASYEAELTRLLQTRLVQTNHVQRALGLRLGLSVIAREVAQPVHLIEVGASAGLNLRFDRYGYHVGGQQFGDQRSPIQLRARWYGNIPVPDLDSLPPLATVTGVDLRPIDAQDHDARRWLEALIWPENHYQRELLATALSLAAADPPTIRAGDATDLCPAIASELPPGTPRVVFHSGTRIHIPPDRLDDFDQAIASFADGGPLYWLSVEGAPDPDPRPDPARHGAALELRGPDGTKTTLAVVEGHLNWIEPLNI